MQKSIIIGSIEWTPKKIKESILCSDIHLYRAILRVYEAQTRDEQRIDNTKHINGVGFGAYDAPILSSFAKQLQVKKSLSPRQREVARKYMPKYATQIFRWMLENINGTKTETNQLTVKEAA